MLRSPDNKFHSETDQHKASGTNSDSKKRKSKVNNRDRNGRRQLIHLQWSLRIPLMNGDAIWMVVLKKNATA